MREDYHILLHVMAGYFSYGSGKTLRGLLGCFTAQHKLSRITKKGCYGAVKLLRAKPGGIAAIMLLQSVHYPHARVHLLSNEMRSFERFRLWACDKHGWCIDGQLVSQQRTLGTTDL